MANDKDKTEKAAPIKPDAPPAADQIVELRAQLEAKGADLAKAQIRIADLEALLFKLEAEYSALKARMEKGSISALPDLGEGSFELTTSVTILNRDGARITPYRGDVVTLVKELAVVQAKVGKARVFAVDKATIDELSKMGALRAS